MMMRLSAIHGALICLLGLALAGTARADLALLVTSDARALELTQALELELRGHGVLAAYRAPAAAHSPLERAAAAQRVGRHASARVALWIESGPAVRLRAVGTGEHDERIVEAPLPIDLSAIDVRAFAQIAASLALEVLGVVRDALPRPEPAALILPMPAWSCTGDFASLGKDGWRTKRPLPSERGRRLPAVRGAAP
jgi:hypothetical protein